MRTLWYLFLFITPTILLVGYFNREPLREFLEEQGYLTSTEEAPEAGVKPPVSESPDPVAEDGAPGEALAPAPAESAVTVREEAHPLPEVKPLLEVVNQWKDVPKNAFPEKVIIRKPVSLAVKREGKVIGQTQSPAGQQLVPISLEGEQLTVARTSDGAGAKGTIHIDDTNFKQLVTKAYSDFMARRKAEQAVKTPSSTQETPPQPTADDKAGLGPEPKVLPGGKIQEMIDSITAGEVQEIKLDKIDYWRWQGYEEISGIGYWTGVVGYVADTIFGELNTEGKALIRGGKVVKWIYSGSEEPIK